MLFNKNTLLWCLLTGDSPLLKLHIKWLWKSQLFLLQWNVSCQRFLCFLETWEALEIYWHGKTVTHILNTRQRQQIWELCPPQLYPPPPAVRPDRRQAAFCPHLQTSPLRLQASKVLDPQSINKWEEEGDGEEPHTSMAETRTPRARGQEDYSKKRLNLHEIVKVRKETDLRPLLMIC